MIVKQLLKIDPCKLEEVIAESSAYCSATSHFYRNWRINSNQTHLIWYGRTGRSFTENFATNQSNRDGESVV